MNPGEPPGSRKHTTVVVGGGFGIGEWMGRPAEFGAEEGPRDDGPTGAIAVLAQGLAEGVAIGRDGRIRWASARLAELTGRRAPGELVGVAFDELLADTGSGLPGIAGARAVDCRVRGIDGAERRLRVACVGSIADDELWVFGDASREERLESEVLELSERLHRTHREAAELRAQLEAEAAERDEMLAIVSHELRTPITVISGYNRLLLANEVGTLNEEQRRFVEESTKSCRKLDTFVGKLLGASREIRALQTCEPVPGSIAEAVADVVAFLRPVLDEHGLRVDVALDPNAVMARFDPSGLEQVLTNLLGNVIQHAGAKEVRVTSAPLRAAGRSFVEVSVVDRGPGVPGTDRGRIFEPFVRGGGGRGLGLGLAICKRIIDAHGGAITVRDHSDGGGCFSFTLPAVDAVRQEEG